MASNCISEQDFLAIREDILEREPAKFDRLYRAADTLLRPYVKSKTRNTQAARSDPNFVDDILQDIHIKLIQTIVTHFFLRDGSEGEHKDALGLTRWMFVVARNTTLTALTKNSQRIPLSLIQDNDDEEEYELPIVDNDVNRQPGTMMEQREAVSQCFNFVIDSGSAGHIVLAFLMISLLTLESGGNRIEAERLFAQKFADKPLDDILDTFRAGVHLKPWLEISNAQLDRFKEKLDAPINGQRSGEYPLKDFAMKKGLEASLSDWLNRMDSRLKKAFQETYYTDSDPVWSSVKTR